MLERMRFARPKLLRVFFALLPIGCSKPSSDAGMPASSAASDTHVGANVKFKPAEKLMGPASSASAAPPAK
jgi:hypothetical protein